MDALNRIPGVAWVAIANGAIYWLQTYLHDWTYTSAAVIGISALLALGKVYLAKPEVPVDPPQARGLGGGSVRGKFSRFLLG